jgi:hypothetical protein
MGGSHCKLAYLSARIFPMGFGIFENFDYTLIEIWNFLFPVIFAR